MKAYLIDDEQPCLDDLAWLLSRYSDIEIAATFTRSLNALAAIENERPDIVFLDINMPRISGLEMAQRIQAKHAGVIIVFVTAYAQYALDAYKAYPLDFLVKPVREDRLDDTVAHVRKQYELLNPACETDDSLKIKCFGPFEVVSPSEARFPTRRVRELLLYMIDRHGVAATRRELLSALFQGKDDHNTINNLYVTLSRLKTLLDCWDKPNGLIRLTSDNALVIAPGVCDYTDFMTFAGQNAALSEQNTATAARILASCQRPYLEKETYEWATQSGLEVETEYERIALGLAGYYKAEGRVLDAENVLCTLLARNPLSEDGYRALLDLYMRSGNRASFAARYEEYARVLRKELRLRPQAAYRDYYAGLKL